MVEYNPKIIYEFAEGLYRKANSIIMGCAFIGFLIGGIVGYGLWKATGAIICAVVVGIIGSIIGTTRASHYKLKAQIALCQVRIEENTKELVIIGHIMRKVEKKLLEIQRHDIESSPLL